ncbi:hypothetical protein LINGRAHAP2_LOCUS5816 [Linum grandiflorum]
MSSSKLLRSLLFGCLLIVASQQSFSVSATEVQAVGSYGFRVKHAHSRSRRDASSHWVGEEKVWKTPSGPNPVGNHNPPIKQ